MFTFLITQWKFVVIALLLAALGVEHMRGNNARTEVYKINTQVAENARKASEAARAEEARRETELGKVAENARTQIEQARADAMSAGVSADRLRVELAAYVARSRKGAGVAVRGQAAADPLDLLAKLYGESDSAEGDLARYADAARIAGLACQASYGSLTR
jgi:hypothetical protein